MFHLLPTKKERALTAKITELDEQVADLKASVERLTDEKRQIEHENKMATEDIEHMVKINAERKEIELEKSKAIIQTAADKEIATTKDEYRDKLEKQLISRSNDLKEMYVQILERLPNVNLAIKQNSGTK